MQFYYNGDILGYDHGIATESELLARFYDSCDGGEHDATIEHDANEVWVEWIEEDERGEPVWRDERVGLIIPTNEQIAEVIAKAKASGGLDPIGNDDDDIEQIAGIGALVRVVSNGDSALDVAVYAGDVVRFVTNINGPVSADW